MKIAAPEARRRASSWLWAVVTLAALVVTACGPSAGATPTRRTSPSPSPTATPRVSPNATATPSVSTSTAASATNAPITPAGLSNLNAPTGLANETGAFTVGFDPVSKRLLLQVEASTAQNEGGFNLTAATWAWDGKTWTQLSPATEPAPETQGSMAVDPVSGELMYMGGSGYTTTSDAADPWIPDWGPNEGTWLWNGSTWTRVADNPEQGGDPALAVDQATNQLLASCPSIQGIETPSGDPGDASPPPTAPAWYETHSGFYGWNGSGWAAVPPLSTSTGAGLGTVNAISLGAAVAYDPISKRVVEFGGNGQGVFNATLAYDGTSWSTLQALGNGGPNVPPGGPASAATDASTGQIIMVAQNIGYAEAQAEGPSTPGPPTTWTWNGTGWGQLAVTGLPAYDTGVSLPPWTGQLVWDPALDQVVLVYTDPSGTIQLEVWGGTSTGWEPVSS